MRPKTIIRAIRRALPCAAASLLLAAGAHAQWDPFQGQWGKAEPTDYRMMTFNILDGVNSLENKSEALNQWTSLARIVAAMQPDVLIMQECGYNGANVDSVANLTTTIQLFLYGGADPFNGGEVGAYVQKYAPGYDLPYIFVSVLTDNFNRNVILSRYPFADLNANGASTYSNFLLFADAYQDGGNGGIRGFMFAEIDLPDDTYAGDVVIGNAHLKSGGTSSDLADRLKAAQNTAYFIDYFYNGAGTGVPDPNNKVRAPASAATILDENTPVLIGGDWNEDELTNGRRGPAAWLTQAEFEGGTDGTDRDRSDATYDDARDVFTNARGTRGGSKLDYLAWQDSIATPRNTWILNSANLNTTTVPPEMDTPGFALMSGRASDHLPVLADIILPLVEEEPECPGDLNNSGNVDGADLGLLLGAWGTNDPDADINNSGNVDGADLGLLLGAWGPCP